MEPSHRCTSPTSRPGADGPRLPLARRRHGRREGHPHRATPTRAAVLGQARVLRRPRPAPEGRAHVALRGGRQRRDRRGRPRRERLPGRGPRAAASPSSCATARTRCAPRSRSPRATPSTSRPRSPGSRRRRSTRSTARRWRPRTGTRRLVGVAAQGMTACPCAQQLVAGTARERLAATTASTTTQIDADPRGRPRRHAQPARPGHAAHRLPRGLRRPRSRRRPCSRSSRGRCRRRSTS